MAVVVLLAGAGVGINLLTRPGTSATRLAPHAAPSVAGPTATGGHFDLEQERGHWILVNFFASWCTDCRRELGQLAGLQQRDPRGLRIVSVDGADDSLSAAERLIRGADGSWPLVDDPAALVAYSVVGLPESFLLDPRGDVVSRIIGALTEADVDRQMDGSAHGASGT